MGQTAKLFFLRSLVGSHQPSWWLTTDLRATHGDKNSCKIVSYVLFGSNCGNRARIPSEVNSNDAAYILQNVLGCKWTLHILGEVRRGVNRNGQLARSAEGLTTKVLNEQLVKLVRFGILKKESYGEVPPRVEYSLSEFGNKFNRLLDEVDRLQADRS